MARNNSPSKSARLKQILKFLSVRARSEKEIRDRLAKYHTPVDEVKLILDKLCSWHLVDDASFTTQYIESRSHSRPRSRKLLELELRHKGVIMNDYRMTANDYELATLALQKKKNLKSRDQAVRFLQYRGFSWEVIEKVIRNQYNNHHVS